MASSFVVVLLRLAATAQLSEIMAEQLDLYNPTYRPIASNTTNLSKD
jgi:hypothetical protein